MTIFISGGSGFIGKNLVEQLDGKYKILLPTHSKLDLLDEKALAKYFNTHNIDVVIHASNVGGSRFTTNLHDVSITNIRMFFNLVRLRQKYKKMIFLGSGAEYDKRRALKKVKESDFDKEVPIDEYGYGKYICSKYIQQTEGILNTRLFGVYGKYEDINLRFISYAICRNILNKSIIINQNVFFDYLYIDDLCRILDIFLQRMPDHKFINVGRGVRIDLLTIAKKINRISEVKSEILLRKKGLNKEYTCDVSLLSEVLGRFEYTDFDETLKEMYQYYLRTKKVWSKYFVD